MSEGYATWESLWKTFYKLDGIIPSSTTDKRDATVITEKRFDLLKENRLIPQVAIFVEIKGA